MREARVIERDAYLVALLYKPTSGEDDNLGKSGPNQVAVPVDRLIAKPCNRPAGDVA